MRPPGFILIELVIVVVIIGVIAAIAIPRLSRGTDGATESSLIADLAVMRKAIDFYVTEHTGTLPTLASFEAQMLAYTDALGNANTTRGGAFTYGPYLRALPPLPLGLKKGENGVKGPPANGTGPYGWVYNQAAGTIVANTASSKMDANDIPFNQY